MIIYSYVYEDYIYNFQDEGHAIASLENLIKEILDNAVEEEYISKDERGTLYDDLTAGIEFEDGYTETIWTEDYTDGHNIKLYAGHIIDRI